MILLVQMREQTQSVTSLRSCSEVMAALVPGQRLIPQLWFLDTYFPS